MDIQEIQKRIEAGRDFLHPRDTAPEDYETDQQLKKPQPPLVKAPMRNERIELPHNFDALPIEHDFLKIINGRRSHRIYTEESMSLLSLSYLLWCTQGIQSIRGKSYATIRTVPCGGARHEFECYMILRNVESLQDGFYHYLPWYHALEFLGTKDPVSTVMTAALDEQTWAAKANVVFLYSYVCYRAEWRYGIDAARMIMADVGHISENMYLAAESIHLGGCAIGAVDGGFCDRLLGLDGKDEFTIYGFTMGRISRETEYHEDDIYAFVKEQGL